MILATPYTLHILSRAGETTISQDMFYPKNNKPPMASSEGEASFIAFGAIPAQSVADYYGESRCFFGAFIVKG